MNTENTNVASYELKSLLSGSWLSYLVGFYIFAFYLELHFRIPVLSTIRFQFIFGAFLSLICLVKFVSEKHSGAAFQPVTKTVFILLFVMGIYTVFAINKEAAFRVYPDRVLKFALVAFFIYVAVNKIADLRVILGFMLLAWLKLGQEGLVGWYTGSMVWENQGIPRLRGSTAMFGHPNSYSGFAVGCLPFCIFLLAAVKSNLLRLGLLALLFCSLIIIMSTGSRTGYVAVLLGALYFFMKLKKGKIKIILLAVVALSLSINFIPEAYKERFNSIFTGEEKEGRSSEKRLEIIEDALAVYSHYPMGVGVASFTKVREQMFARNQDTHNLYLEILTNIGPVGLVLFIVFIKNIITLNNKNCSRIKTQPYLPNSDAKLMNNLCLAINGFIFLRLLLGLFGMDMYEIYWWMALGFTLAINKLLILQDAQDQLAALELLQQKQRITT